MNTFSGTVRSLQSHQNMSRVSVACGDDVISCVLLGIPEGVVEGSLVEMVFKETEVALSTGDGSHISIANRFSCRVVQVREGVIVSEVSLATQDGKSLVSIVTTDSLRRLGIKEGNVVTALIKANEVSLERKGG